jgi:hypothetical protein
MSEVSATQVTIFWLIDVPWSPETSAALDPDHGEDQ